MAVKQWVTLVAAVLAFSLLWLNNSEGGERILSYFSESSSEHNDQVRKEFIVSEAKERDQYLKDRLTFFRVKVQGDREFCFAASGYSHGEVMTTVPCEDWMK